MIWPDQANIAASQRSSGAYRQSIAQRSKRICCSRARGENSSLFAARPGWRANNGRPAKQMSVIEGRQSGEPTQFARANLRRPSAHIVLAANRGRRRCDDRAFGVKGGRRGNTANDRQRHVAQMMDSYLSAMTRITEKLDTCDLPAHRSLMGETRLIEHAPITEVLLTVEFRPILAELSLLDLADLYGEFASEFPKFDQIAPAGATAHVLGHLDGSVPLEVHVPQFPRLRFRDRSNVFQIMIQDDRISFGWNRTVALNEEPHYAGFESVQAGFQKAINKLRSWLSDRKGLKIEPTVAELAYTNGILTRRPDGTLKRLSSIFRFMNPERHVAINGYSMTWNERFGEGGFVTVSCLGR